jgi:hypothetical protein
MPRGGARPGSGPQRSMEDPNATEVLSAPHPGRTYERLARQLDEFKRHAQAAQPLPGAKIIDGELVMPDGWMTPLVYMAGLLNNPEVDALRRDRIAQAMAPYLHPKRAEVGIGAKQKAEDQAKRAGDGTEWAGILRTAA